MELYSFNPIAHGYEILRSRNPSHDLCEVYYLSSVTNSDGRCTDFLVQANSQSPLELEAGIYKMIFKTKDYFDQTNRKCFYPWAEVR